MEVARQSGPGSEMAVLTGLNAETSGQLELYGLYGLFQDESEDEKENATAQESQKSN